MQDIEQALPFKLLGIDSDNGSEFINYHLKTFCDEKDIQLTRGRPYKKDDNAHIEQKNYTHVRKILGYLRYDSQGGSKSHQRALPKRIENLTKSVSPGHEANEENPGRLQAQALATTNPRPRWNGCSNAPRPIRSKSNSLNGYATKPIPLSWPNAWSKNLSASLGWPTSASARNPKIPLAHPRRAVKNRLSVRSPRSLELNSRNDPDGLDRSRQRESKITRANKTLGEPKSLAHNPLTGGCPGKGRCHCVDPGANVEEKFQHQSPDFQKTTGCQTKTTTTCLVHINLWRKPK